MKQKLIKFFTIKNVFIVAILIRIPLLYLVPISLYTDGLDRHIPDVEKLLNGSLDFWYPPLYTFFIAIPKFLLSENLFHLFLKLSSLVFFCLVFWQGKKFLEKLNFSEKKSTLILFIFSFLSWPLLLSETFISDMFFTFLVLLFINLIWNIDENLSWKKYLKIGFVFFLLLTIKPMALFMIPGYFIFLFLKKVSWKTFLIFTITCLVAFAAFSPWLIKNQVSYGSFFLTNTEEQNASMFSFVGINEFPHQVQKSFEYFWEFPGWEKVQNFKNNFSNNFLKTGVEFYYFVNIISFAIISALILFFIIKKLLVEKDIQSWKIFSLMIFCFGFAALYWPFFSKYDYWDTGRYTLPVLVLLIIFLSFFTELKNKWLKYFAGLIILFTLIFSVLNSYFIAYTFNRYEKDVKEVVEKIDNRKNIFTNDVYSKVVITYYLHKNVNYKEDLDILNCINIQVINNYKICSDGNEVKVIRNSVSRNVG